jgi:hypothetical protein
MDCADESTWNKLLLDASTIAFFIRGGESPRISDNKKVTISNWHRRNENAVGRVTMPSIDEFAHQLSTVSTKGSCLESPRTRNNT